MKAIPAFAQSQYKLEAAGSWRENLYLAMGFVFCLWLGFQVVFGAFFVSLYPMSEEVSLLHYVAWLIDKRNFVPYRDVFETAYPGSFILHIIIGGLSDYTDKGFRVADCIYTGMLLVATWRLMLRLGRMVAWISALSFGVVYYSYGSGMTLQRDYICILPVVLSLLLALQNDGKFLFRSVAIGVLMGFAASVKPHIVIGVPVMLWAVVNSPAANTSKNKNALQVVFAWILGMCIGFGLPLLWVFQKGGLPAFSHMALDYMGVYLYGDAHDPEWSMQHSIKITCMWLAFMALPWVFVLIPSFARGFYATRAENENKKEGRRTIWVLLIMLVLYWLYPVPANKFYAYHRMPFYYFATISASLLTMPLANRGWKSFAVAMAGYAMYVGFMTNYIFPPASETVAEIKEWYKRGVSVSFDRSSDAIGAYLKENLRPGEVVQPIEEGGPSMRGMRNSQAVIATPYLTFDQLVTAYEHPVVRTMREDFMQRIQRSPPAFILHAYSHTPLAAPISAPRHFPEFDAWVAANYHLSLSVCPNPDNCLVRIFERNGR